MNLKTFSSHFVLIFTFLTVLLASSSSNSTLKTLNQLKLSFPSLRIHFYSVGESKVQMLFGVFHYKKDIVETYSFHTLFDQFFNDEGVDLAELPKKWFDHVECTINEMITSFHNESFYSTRLLEDHVLFYSKITYRLIKESAGYKNDAVVKIETEKVSSENPENADFDFPDYINDAMILLLTTFTKQIDNDFKFTWLLLQNLKKNTNSLALFKVEGMLSNFNSSNTEKPKIFYLMHVHSLTKPGRSKMFVVTFYSCQNLTNNTKEIIEEAEKAISNDCDPSSLSTDFRFLISEHVYRINFYKESENIREFELNTFSQIVFDDKLRKLEDNIKLTTSHEISTNQDQTSIINFKLKFDDTKYPKLYEELQQNLTSLFESNTVPLTNINENSQLYDQNSSSFSLQYNYEKLQKEYYFFNF